MSPLKRAKGGEREDATSNSQSVTFIGISLYLTGFKFLFSINDDMYEG
jgi:hypothetical protein